MAVYVYPADMMGCGHYRLVWPAEALRAQGYDVKVVTPERRGYSLFAELDGERVVGVRYPRDATTIVLQRITHQRLVQAIKMMADEGVKIVVDMDDDLAVIDPNNPAWSAMHPKLGHNSHHSWHNAQRACEVASLVTLSADALLSRYAPHGRGVVIRNYVPERYLNVKHDDSTNVGWGGALHVHPGDVDVMGTAIAQLTQSGERFHVIGPGAGVAHALRCPDDAIDATGPRDLLTEWPEALTTLGIGVAPLADTKFNESKSRLKVLEYSAVGVPWVASPRKEYARVHRETGVGLLAEKPKHWSAKLRSLMREQTLRDELSQAGREWAATQTIEGNTHLWAEAWSATLKR